MSSMLLLLLLFLNAIIRSSSDCPSWKYTECAWEGGLCNVPNGNMYVSYGINGRFSIRKVVASADSTQVSCDNRYGDPYSGVRKQCCYATADDFSGSGYDGLHFNHCASEGGSCGGLDGSTAYWIKYGAGSRYGYQLIQSSSGSVPCTNGIFTDVYPGVRKQCYKATPVSMGYQLTATPMQCYQDSHEVNYWDGNHDNIQTQYWLNGQHSYHNNHREDRRFKWRYCKPNGDSAPFTSTGSLSQTGYDEEWSRTCNSRNGGHSALIGGLSHHDNHREDRQWTFHCGDLDASKYRLEDCQWTGDKNSYDGNLDYDCSDDRVMRGIYSRHNNHHEDRIWRFECCMTRDISYEFHDIVGQWVRISSCANCPWYTYSKTEGIENSQMQSITNSYTNSLSIAVSAGFEYKSQPGGVGAGGSLSVTVTGEVSRTTSSTIESAFSSTYHETITVQCDRDHMFEWRTSATESIEGVQRTITIHGGNYICTDEDAPQCPPGWCNDGDCQRPCKDGYSES